MKKILLVTVITALFIAYLFQHRYSVKCTQEIAKLEKNKQLLNEEIIALESKKAELFLFVKFLNSAQELNLTFSKKYRTNSNLPKVTVTYNLTPPIKINSSHQIDTSLVSSSSSNSHE